MTNTNALTHVTGSKNKALIRRLGEEVIDAKSGEVRGRFFTPGMDGVYSEKRDEAKAYLKAYNPNNPPALTDYPYLAAEIGITAPSAKALAELWIARHNQSRTAGPFIEAIRIAAKAQVRAARSQAEIDTIVADAVIQLDEIGIKPPDKPTKHSKRFQPRP